MSSVADLLAQLKIVPKEGDRVELLPNGEVVFYSDASHRYWHLEQGTEGKRPGKRTLYSVTSVLKVLDKPGLLSWVYDVTLEGRKYWEVRNEASTRGTSVHDAGQHLADTGEAPDLSKFPEDDRPFVQALARAWLALRPQVIATEVIVASLEHGFAGRFDLLADVDGARCLIDYKTGRRVYPVEQFAQLAAYELAGTESGHPPTDRQLIVRLGENGSFEVAESCASAADFLAIKSVFDLQRRIEAEHKAVSEPKVAA